MVIKDGNDGMNLPAKEITPPEVYFGRRTFLRGAILAGSVAATTGVYGLASGWFRRKVKLESGQKLVAATLPADAPMSEAQRTAAGYFVNEPQTPLEYVAGYNNYYEFSVSKTGVAARAEKFSTRPWTLRVEGLVNKPKTFDLDDLTKIAPLEERVYRHRCVETWSMVIPWLGFPLASLLKQVEPRSDAKFVAFESMADPARMPYLEDGGLPWPYREGLRMDEAMHPLTLLSVGLYGQTLLPQNGAPIRLVVPWKYGFKGIKAIVRIRLVEEQPVATWNQVNPPEYGFYSNVNPDHPHPRWSQASERRLPSEAIRDTLMFNGYGAQVADLYKGMDLDQYY